MTLKNLIEEFETIASEQPNIKFCGNGDIFTLNSIPDIDYGVFFITQNSHLVFENTTQYSLNLFYIDRLINEETDWNKLQIQSDGIQVLNNIINTFVDENDLVVDYPVRYTSFNERFSDDCAGVYCTLIITVPNLGICSY